MSDQVVLEKALKPNEKWRIVKNVGAIGLAFMMYFIAYSGAANLQSSINAEAGLGTMSLASIYAGVLISNIFLSGFVLKWLGTKSAMWCSLIIYVPFIASQMHARFYTLIPAAFLLGLASGPLWCAMCTYLSVAADAYSTLSKISAGVILQRFFGFFYTFYQTGQIWGNLISSLVLSTNNKASITTINDSMIPQLCGANFIVDTNASIALPTQPPEKILMLTGVYLAFLLASVLVVALGLDSMKRYEPYRKNTGNRLSGIALLAASMKLFTEVDQLLFVIIYIFLGIQQAFMSADFTASFVSCAIGTGSVGYVMMAFGVTDAMGCVLTGYLAKLFGRLPLVISALITHMGVILMLLLWRPHAGDYHVMVIIAVVWGLCDSVWLAQMNSYCGVIFHGKEEAAFPNIRLCEGVGFMIAYMLSSYVRTRYKIYMLLGTLIVGISGYFILEYKHRSAETVEQKIKGDKIENRQEPMFLEIQCDKSTVL
ncbi:unnamed protein product [Arctia plantaginis]|uniref:UNC93-like protein n=1 Tax=Arctia plantaginis TaxID=874455 RepID=A0A8S1BMZ6_ARCPL|nr:unnamed protein product [Arctia plantaginis]